MDDRSVRSGKIPILVVTLASVLLADYVTKRWAMVALSGGDQIRLLGGLLPLTLAFNKGAAFSIHLGPMSRWIFLALSVVALSVLIPLYRATHARDRARLLAIALVLAGAVGNMIDRVRWDRGVVDFIGPIDLGFTLWPIFNVADMAITTGAVLLMLSLLRENQAAPSGERPGP